MQRCTILGTELEWNSKPWRLALRSSASFSSSKGLEILGRISSPSANVKAKHTCPLLVFDRTVILCRDCPVPTEDKTYSVAKVLTHMCPLDSAVWVSRKAILSLENVADNKQTESTRLPVPVPASVPGRLRPALRYLEASC